MTANQIAAMLHTPSKTFQLHHMNIMKLSDSYDCGVFAIAITETINAWTHLQNASTSNYMHLLGSTQNDINPHQNNSLFLDTSLVNMFRCTMYVDGHEMAMGF